MSLNTVKATDFPGVLLSDAPCADVYSCAVRISNSRGVVSAAFGAW